MGKLKEREVIKRLKSESPEFFKKLQWFGGILVTISPFLLLFPLTAPFSLITGTSGALITGISKLPVKGISLDDAKKLKEEAEKLKLELENLKALKN
jgi:hypothetical protein